MDERLDCSISIHLDKGSVPGMGRAIGAELEQVVVDPRIGGKSVFVIVEPQGAFTEQWFVHLVGNDGVERDIPRWVAGFSPDHSGIIEDVPIRTARDGLHALVVTSGGQRRAIRLFRVEFLATSAE